LGFTLFSGEDNNVLMLPNQPDCENQQKMTTNQQGFLSVFTVQEKNSTQTL